MADVFFPCNYPISVSVLILPGVAEFHKGVWQPALHFNLTRILCKVLFFSFTLEFTIEIVSPG